MTLTDKTLTALCVQMYNKPARHRREVAFDPHCFDDIGNTNTEAKLLANDTLVILGFAALTCVLVVAVNAVFS